MAFPAENTLEQAYRNAIEDVSLYLESTHKGHYMVFNLSAEKQYDSSHFKNNVKSSSNYSCFLIDLNPRW